MTIGTASRVSLACDGVTKVFPVAIQAYAATDLTVILTAPTSAGGGESTLTLNSDYSLAPSGTLEPTAWTLTTLPTNAYITGYTLQVFPNPVQSQQTKYVQGQPFPSLAVQTNFDRLTQMVQRLQDQASRAIHAPDGDVDPLMLLPIAAQRAGFALFFDALGNPSLGAIPTLAFTQASFNAFLGLAPPYVQTAAEAAAGVTPTNTAYQGLEVIDVLRYGIIPNSPGAASTNTTALIALLNPNNTGPTGRLIFPNTTGADTYYFNNFTQVRDGIRMDLQWCTLSFSKTYAAADDCFGFFTFIRDVSIENGTINITYTNTGGNNAGSILRLGGRSGGVAPTYNFGSITPANFFESLFALPMGNIHLKNLRLTTNNSTPAILMLGGLQNCTLENLYINGGGVCSFGIYYEFGNYSQNGSPGTPSLWSTAHGRNLNFKNINVTNMVPAGIGADGAGIGLTGAYSCIVDGLFVDTAYNGFEFRPGEALFYRVGTPDTVGAKRAITLRNIVCQNITSTGLVLQGASSASGGYLAALIAALGHPADYVAQTDLMNFSLDGFAISAAGAGLNVSGPCDIRNGILNGAASGGQIIITDECTRFSFTNVQVLNSSSTGVRANFGNAIWSPARRKIGTFDACLIAGNIGPGIAIYNCKSVKVRACRFGYSTLYDAAAEATQTNAISVDATTGGGGVHAEGCFVTTSGGALAYSITGSSTQLLDCCNIANPKGTVTFTGGMWDVDGIAQVSQAQLGPDAGSKNTYINNLNGTAGITNKYRGRLAYDTTNNRLMIAQGPGATDTWIRVDGGVTVTPS